MASLLLPKFLIVVKLQKGLLMLLNVSEPITN